VRRTVALLLLLALVAGGVVAVWAATASNNDSVQLRKVVYDDANRVADELNQLIDDNTR
jgi:hypothetical protein